MISVSHITIFSRLNDMADAQPVHSEDSLYCAEGHLPLIRELEDFKPLIVSRLLVSTHSDITDDYPGHLVMKSEYPIPVCKKHLISYIVPFCQKRPFYFTSGRKAVRAWINIEFRLPLCRSSKRQHIEARNRFLQYHAVGGQHWSKLHFSTVKFQKP